MQRRDKEPKCTHNTAIKKKKNFPADQGRKILSETENHYPRIILRELAPTHAHVMLTGGHLVMGNTHLGILSLETAPVDDWVFRSAKRLREKNKNVTVLKQRVEN